MTLLAIDPGLKGGLALFVDGIRVLHQPLPLIHLKPPGRKPRDLVDIVTLQMLMKAQTVDRVVIETPVAMPEQSSTSTATSFTNYGLLLALRLFAPVSEVQPSEWKKHFRLGKDKKKAIARAKELVPHDGRLTDGEAEAILIGHYWITRGEAHERDRATRAFEAAARRKKRAVAKAARTRARNRQPSRHQDAPRKPARPRAALP